MKAKYRLMKLEKKFAEYEPDSIVFFLCPWESVEEKFEEYVRRGGNPNATVSKVFRYTLAVGPNTPLEDIPEQWRNGYVRIKRPD